MEGYVRLYRSSIDSAVFQDDALWKVWSWCIMRATWKERWVSFPTGRGNSEVHLLPGQFIFGRHTAEKELRQDGASAARRLEKLERLGFLSRQPSTHYTIVTITNWGSYSGDESSSEQATEQAMSRQRAGNEHKQERKNSKKERKEDANADGIPPEIDTPEFRAIWAEWEQHRAEKGGKFTSVARKRQFASLAEMGLARAIAAIANSIKHNYTGIFEERGSSNGNGKPAPKTAPAPTPTVVNVKNPNLLRDYQKEENP